ncbi:SAM-dependent methyltransferase [Aliiglaciecola sp. LCG003]|uniref:tRNA (guanine(46)-N(7))-methyltransferase TrmB n=1 Tax=Aliiglaciecola sp. LCG003 TaxID=3053655 RepID=UPI002572D0F6|nr:SAM-dependent methyltransferase [Aliiglaciecola sp. LCG003]WJG09150.1 SAM-dependent methyltransferase [Aliiglaciecola sp. LCG003]
MSHHSNESGNSRRITTNQLGPHEKIPQLVNRHLANTSQKPFNQHTMEAFKQVVAWRDKIDPTAARPLIFDSCCGVGESTARIAERFPDALVVGIDKSELRTLKHDHYAQNTANYMVVRADVNDFWRLAHQANWQLAQHFLLYPNPYPKSAHVQRRWHACAAFKDIILLGGCLEVRSNWDMYVQEFAIALQTAGFPATTKEYSGAKADTPFERKYWASGQQSWRVTCQLSPLDQ